MPRDKHYKVWLDGKIVPPEDATLSVFTLTVLRGANVYEGLRAYWNPARQNLYVWKLDEHLIRLGHSMKVMRMQLPYSRDELRAAVVEWLRVNDFHDDVHFRLVAYFGDGGAGGVKAYRPDEIDTGAFILGGPRPHDDKLERGLRMGVATWRRIADDVVPARVKAGANYQNNRLAAVEARENGFDDAILLTQGGKVAEATGAALMMVREGHLVVPPVTDGVLESITRRSVLELYAREYGRAAIERSIDRTELYVCDEILICGSAEEVTPVVAVDRLPVGDGKAGPITKCLQRLFFAAARGDDPAFARSLTPVYTPES
jgi:branched-chain amino acid aminotransferase, group I